MWLTRGTLIGERFSLLFFLFYVFLIALGPALQQHGLQDFLWFLFSLVSFFSILLFFCHFQYFTVWFLFSIASFRPSVGFDNVQSLQRLPAHLTSTFFSCFLFLPFLSHVPRNVLLRLFFTNFYRPSLSS